MRWFHMPSLREQIEKLENPYVMDKNAAIGYMRGINDVLAIVDTHAVEHTRMITALEQLLIDYGARLDAYQDELDRLRTENQRLKLEVNAFGASILTSGDGPLR